MPDKRYLQLTGRDILPLIRHKEHAPRAEEVVKNTAKLAEVVENTESAGLSPRIRTRYRAGDRPLRAHPNADREAHRRERVPRKTARLNGVSWAPCSEDQPLDHHSTPT